MSNSRNTSNSSDYKIPPSSEFLIENMQAQLKMVSNTESTGSIVIKWVSEQIDVFAKVYKAIKTSHQKQTQPLIDLKITIIKAHAAFQNAAIVEAIKEELLTQYPHVTENIHTQFEPLLNKTTAIKGLLNQIALETMIQEETKAEKLDSLEKLDNEISDIIQNATEIADHLLTEEKPNPSSLLPVDEQDEVKKDKEPFINEILEYNERLSTAFIIALEKHFLGEELIKKLEKIKNSNNTDDNKNIQSQALIEAFFKKLNAKPTKNKYQHLLGVILTPIYRSDRVNIQTPYAAYIRKCMETNNVERPKLERTYPETLFCHKLVVNPYLAIATEMNFYQLLINLSRDKQIATPKPPRP